MQITTLSPAQQVLQCTRAELLAHWKDKESYWETADGKSRYWASEFDPVHHLGDRLLATTSRFKTAEGLPLAAGGVPDEAQLTYVLDTLEHPPYGDTQGTNSQVSGPRPGITYQKLLGHRGPALGLAPSLDGTRLATAGEDRTVRVWSIDSGSTLFIQNRRIAPVRVVAWSPVDDRLASGGDDSMVQVWKADGTPLDEQAHPAPLCAVAWSPDGSKIASASVATSAQLSSFRIWDAHTRQIVFYDTHPKSFRGVAWAPDGQGWALLKEQVVGIAEIGPFGKGQERLLQVAAQAVAWAPDGGRLALAVGDEVQVWDVQNGCSLLPYAGHTCPVLTVAWSPDGHFLASGGEDTTVQVWAPDGTPHVTYQQHTDVITAVCWLPDSQQVASASMDGSVHVWQARKCDGDLLCSRVLLPGAGGWHACSCSRWDWCC